jgi:CTP:molybdopterin cytidylyltransferase MocA
LYALFLAAGEGRRFGGPKLLRPHRGRPLVAYALDTLAQARADGLIAGGVAVVPERNTALRQLARDRGLRVTPNGDPGRGVSHSLRLGFAALETMALVPTPTAALILFGDQPRVPAGTLRTIVGAWRAGRAQVVRPAYGEGRTPGHPLVVDRAAWHLAAALDGDQECGDLAAARPGLLATLPVAGENPDIDTPDDLARLDAD